MSHAITYPTSSSVGCTCGWSTEVPLGHSLTDTFLDQHFARTHGDPESEEA